MTRKTEHQLRREVADVSALLWDRGWVANHDGNVTARLPGGGFVATPTGISKRLIRSDGLIVVDATRRVLRGRAKPFSELGLHLVVYGARPDVGAVVHAHPPYATARAVAERALPCFLPEAVVSLGAEVPVVPFTAPGAEAERALGPFVAPFDVVMLGRHGVLAWGDDIEQAFLRLELAEHLAKIASVGAAEPAPLPAPL
ncbi:MAG: class II aldolase/adducin family protein, partial [Polyangiales bacterium]